VYLDASNISTTGEWTSQNISVPENHAPDTNTTSPEEARGDFPFDQPGTFTFNMKSEHTKEDRVKFIDVCASSMGINGHSAMLIYICVSVTGVYTITERRAGRFRCVVGS
jgi:hypothetical protein